MKRTINIFTISLVLLMGVLLVSCNKEEIKQGEQASYGVLKTDSESYLPIYMGQHTLIGEAFITLENSTIYVEVSLVDGIVPDEAHLYAGENPPPSSAPGSFPYHWYPGDPFPVMFAIDISSWYECQEFDWYFALHMAVGTETAWILPEGGIYWYNKKGKKLGWGQYFLHYFGACDEPPVG